MTGRLSAPTNAIDLQPAGVLHCAGPMASAAFKDIVLRRIAIAVCVTGIALVAGRAAAEPRGVVELFTSQGCSSCPPADKLLGQLASEPDIVALSLPVDYWDYIGWKDTLANPHNSARQKAYAAARGDRQIYTPQVVVNGMVHALGSDKDAIEHAIDQTRHNAAALSVPVHLKREGNQIVVSVDAGKPDAHGEVWLCRMVHAVPVKIGRGENRDKTLTYYNVVRTREKLGTLTGSPQTWHVPAVVSDTYKDDEAAVLVQTVDDGRPGVILGAAVARLAE
jgi:hypothetical protein